MDKRSLNERKFKNWIELENGGREYRTEVKGRTGWKTIYVKIISFKDI